MAAASGRGSALTDIPDYFSSGHPLYAPSYDMFWRWHDRRRYLPQLIDETGIWDTTTDGDGVLHDLGGSKIIAVDGSVTDEFIKQDDGSYQVQGPSHDKLSFTSGQYVLTDASGSVLTFHDFSFKPSEFTGFNGSLPAMPADQMLLGQPLSIADGGGNVATMNYNSTTYRLDSVVVSSPSGTFGNAVEDKYAFDYITDTSDPNYGMVSAVTHWRSTDSGATWSIFVQKDAYQYYTGSTSGAESFGGQGDLMLATIEDASGNHLSTTYCRYFTSGTSAGELKFMLSDASYRRLVAVEGSESAGARRQRYRRGKRCGRATRLLF